MASILLIAEDRTVLDTGVKFKDSVGTRSTLHSLMNSIFQSISQGQAQNKGCIFYYKYPYNNPSSFIGKSHNIGQLL